MNKTPYRQFVERNGGFPAFKQPGRNRFAITIHVIQIGETGWVWELRNLDGSLFTDSTRDGEYGCFANPIEAFDDATENARDRFNQFVESQLIEIEG